MTLEQIDFNKQMDRNIAAVKAMTQEQVNACAWLMGCSNGGWTPEKMVEEFEAEKHTDSYVYN